MLAISLTTTMPPRRRTAIIVGAAVLAIALAANAAMALYSIRVLDESFDKVERPIEVQRTLVRLLSAVQDAETGQRGYLLTGSPSYLEPYNTARNDVRTLLESLSRLVSWNQLQVRRLPALRDAIQEKLDEVDETVRLYDDVSPSAALDVVETGRGRRAMDEIRSRLDEMGVEATRVRAMHTARSTRARDRARNAAWTSTAGLATLLLLLSLGLRAESRRRERYTERLASSNAALSTALGEREAALGRVRAMQAQLVQQEKLAGMGRLTAGVAHEIKNPLNFVTNFASLTVDLSDEIVEAAQRGDTAEVYTLAASIRQNVSKILQHGERADDIVQSMLVHARGVTGARRMVSLGELVQAAVSQAVGPHGAGDVDISIDMDSGLGHANVVPESVTRAVRNLVENALHAVRQRNGAGDLTYSPAISVTVSEGADHEGHAAGIVRVYDNGAGISDELFPRIFEPFFTTKGPGSGSGLGLSLAHDIAVGHGGTLLAERPAEGGVAFVLTLPLEAPVGLVDGAVGVGLEGSAV